MKLISIALTNFKGVKEFKLDLNGKNATIYGDNATGKTTLYDGFLWLLFDKDSQNKSNFAIKTLDADGNVIHGLDHEVEATLLVKSKHITFKKSFKEKWTKKRGQATAEFTGHTTEYFIDGVPVKKSEYEDKIAEIADEAVFKLLTNPAYFNEQLSWQDRRKTLLEIAGDIEDADVIASKKELAELPGILGDKSTDDYKKIIKAKRTEINEHLEMIPVRIDEVMRNLPDISGIDAKALELAIEKANKLIDEKQKEISGLENGTIGLSNKIIKLQKLENQILAKQNELMKANNATIKKKEEELAAVKVEIRNLTDEMAQNERKNKFDQEAITDLEQKMEALRNEWQELANKELELDTVCPTCGQDLPEGQVDDAIANYNLAKAKKLEEITSKGKEHKAKVAELKADIKERCKLLEKQWIELEGLKLKETTLNETIMQTNQSEPQDAELEDLIAESANLKTEIELLKSGNKDQIDDAKVELLKLVSELKALEQEQANIKIYNDGQKRIEELKKQERLLASEFERLEKENYLIEQFVRAKVALLEDKINSKFKLARFKLFDTQVNGAVAEVCDTLYKGVPYGSGLNNAAKINVGLDIITTLSKHYNFYAPIFIDNAEAVVELVPVDAQIIKLVVSGGDKKLRVEVE
jgi:DNA repair exonuclease SbcCD ATPase subunit